MSRCDHWNVARVRLVEISIPERGRQGRHENAVEMAIENHVERRRHAVRCGPRFDPRGDHAEFLCGASTTSANMPQTGDPQSMMAIFLPVGFLATVGYGKGRGMSGMALDDRFRFVGLRMILSVSR